MCRTVASGCVVAPCISIGFFYHCLQYLKLVREKNSEKMLAPRISYSVFLVIVLFRPALTLLPQFVQLVIENYF